MIGVEFEGTSPWQQRFKVEELFPRLQTQVIFHSVRLDHLLVLLLSIGELLAVVN